MNALRRSHADRWIAGWRRLQCCRARLPSECLRSDQDNLNGARSSVDRPSRTHSANASPSAAECLKPWPEHAQTTTACSTAGCRSMMKRDCGATLYRQAEAWLRCAVMPRSRPRTCSACSAALSDSLTSHDVRACASRQFELRRDALLRPQEAGCGLEAAVLVAAQRELREAFADACCVKQLVRYAELPGHSDRAADEVGLTVQGGAALRRSHHEAAALHEQLHAPRRFDLAPDLVRAPHERHVLRPFTDGQARDASRPVTRPTVVRGRVAIDPEHPRAAPGKLVKRGAAHRAQADDDGVEIQRAAPRLTGRLPSARTGSPSRCAIAFA